MEAELRARGWSRARIRAAIGTEPEPEPDPAPYRTQRAAQVVSPRSVSNGYVHNERKTAVKPQIPDAEMLLDLGPRARRKALAAAGLPPGALSPRKRVPTEAVRGRARHRERAAAKRAGPRTPAASTGSERKLTPASVYVRIRPLAQDGNHAEGERVKKHLECWSDSSVTIATEYLFSTGEAEYTFPRQVFGPEKSQREVWEGANGPGLVQQFTKFGGFNSIFFAYGQTGAGKTHTMLGTPESLVSDSLHTGWGIFPRACKAVFDTMDQSGRLYSLQASAVEFYMCKCLDLLDSGSELQIDPDSHAVRGAKHIKLSELAELLPFLAQVQTNRTTRSTAMNRAEGEHGGSSRSHAALILTLTQLDDARENVAKTTFTLMDLAGAERPSRTAEKRYSGGQMALYMLNELGSTRAGGGRVGDPLNRPTTIQEIPTGCQALIINMELYGVGSEVLKATECHHSGRPYKSPKQSATPAVKFLSACLDGTALAYMMVCVSPAGQNGWETWFSLQYGTNLAALRAQVKSQPARPYEKACTLAARAARKARAEFEAAARNKYWEGRRMKMVESAQQLETLQSLQGDMSC